MQIVKDHPLFTLFASSTVAQVPFSAIHSMHYIFYSGLLSK